MFFVKDLVLKGCLFGLVAITVAIHLYMACRNIIRVVFGIDTLEQHIEAQKTRLCFDVNLSIAMHFDIPIFSC